MALLKLLPGLEVPEGPFTLVYDVELRRPGCVLLQVAMGGTVPSEIFQMLFPNETWLLAPTPEMKPYRTTREQLLVVVTKTEIPNHRGKGPSGSEP